MFSAKWALRLLICLTCLSLAVEARGLWKNLTRTVIRNGTEVVEGIMKYPRYSHTATLMPNTGEVLVIGGRGGHPKTVYAVSELYNTSGALWRSVGALLTPRYEHRATLMPNGHVLVTGGFAGDSASATLSCEMYDNSTSQFYAVAPLLNYSRIWHTATLLKDGKVLVVGGYDVAKDPNREYDPSYFLGSTQLYDPASNTWTVVGGLNTPRFMHTATLLPSGAVLITGGVVDKDYTATASSELYDPITQTWTITGALGDTRAWHRALRLPNGDVHVSGGFFTSGGNTIVLRSSEIYALSTSKWTCDVKNPVVTASNGGQNCPASMNDARYLHSAVSIKNGDGILVVGGFPDLASSEVYNISTGLWYGTDRRVTNCSSHSEFTNVTELFRKTYCMETTRWSHTSTLLQDGTVMTTGGYTRGDLPDLDPGFTELFDPYDTSSPTFEGLCNQDATCWKCDLPNTECSQGQPYVFNITQVDRYCCGFEDQTVACPSQCCMGLQDIKTQRCCLNGKIERTSDIDEGEVFCV